jgi:polyketide biosynthesis enoyl-CoA hydratase PksI
MSSDVVQLQEIAPGVAQITMQDRVHKNTFSIELTSGLIDAFQHI